MCVKNTGVEASLLVGNVDKVVQPEMNDGLREVRVTDEEHEDYLYPASFFVEIDILLRARRAFMLAQVVA